MTLADAAPFLTPAQRQEAIRRLTAAGVNAAESMIRSVELALYREWMTTGRYVSTVEEWASIYASIVSAAQAEMFVMQTAQIAEHVSLASGAAVTGAMPALAADAGWVVSEVGWQARVGQIRLRQQLIDGIPFNNASDLAGRYIYGVAAKDIQRAQREAGTAWSDSDVGRRHRVNGWRKVPSGAACGWCIVVSDRIYYSRSVPAHDYDRCGFSPVVDGDGWKAGSLSGRSADQAELLKVRADPDASTLPLESSEANQALVSVLDSAKDI